MLRLMDIIKGINEFIKIIAESDEKSTGSLNDKYGETITPNMRALRLSMTVADYLLSMNVPVSDVVGTSLDITNRYCKRKVSVDISSTVLMFSQDRGVNKEPLTLIRTSTSRSVNILTIQALLELTEDIRFGKLPLKNAEDRLKKIINHTKQYPRWLLDIGNASISAGVGAMLSGNLLVITISFLVGGFISHLLIRLAEERMPAFFIQAAAATFITMIAAIIAWLGGNGVDSLSRLDPNLVIIGGIVMLLSGMAIVGAVEDAIDEYYVTANARILRVVMMTAGIIGGIVFGLFLAKQIGVNLVINTDKSMLDSLGWQFIGVVMIAVGYAVSTHARIQGIALSIILGAISWSVYQLGLVYFTQVVSVFLASMSVGSMATLLSRWLRTPSSIMITAGVIPLVPGRMLFNGLMSLILLSPTTNQRIEPGATLLINALLIALAIAAGATLGRLLTRPVRRTLVRAQNALPIRKLNTYN